MSREEDKDRRCAVLIEMRLPEISMFSKIPRDLMWAHCGGLRLLGRRMERIVECPLPIPSLTTSVIEASGVHM